MRRTIMLRDVVDAYTAQGGESEWSEIYKYFEQNRKIDGLPPNYKEEIRSLVYSHSRDSSGKPKSNVFHKGHGRGVWGLN